MKTQVFGRGTRRVVIQPRTLVTVGGYAIAVWEYGQWLPCFKRVHLHTPTVAKTLATVFPNNCSESLQAIGAGFAVAAIWADSEEGSSPRVTSQLVNVGMALAAHLAQLQPAAVGEAIERQGLQQFGHDLFLTVAGHGAGFWDRQELQADDVGDTLTDTVRGWYLETEQYRGHMSAHARVPA